MKACNKCGEEKSLDDFHRNGSAKDGRKNACKECERVRSKAYRQGNEDAVRETVRGSMRKRRASGVGREYDRRWKRDNADRVNERARARYAVNREREAERHRRYAAEHPEVQTNARLRRVYGITLEQYEALLDYQGGCCAVCGATESLDGTRLQVDHDHACHPFESGCPACIRGLLCRVCNLNDRLAGHPAVAWEEVLGHQIHAETR